MGIMTEKMKTELRSVVEYYAAKRISVTRIRKLNNGDYHVSTGTDSFYAKMIRDESGAILRDSQMVVQ